VIHGGASPALLSDVVGYPRLEHAVCQALDSVYKAWVPLDMHAVDVARRLLRCPAPKHTYHQPTILPDDVNCASFDRQASAVALHTGFHSHMATCRKTASGKTGCRMARPAGHPVPATRVLSITAAATGVDASTAAPNPSEGEVEWRCPHCSANGHIKGGACQALSVHRPETGDVNVTGLSLSYELQRPLVAPEESISPALCELLSMSAEDAAALQPCNAVKSVRIVLAELGPFLAKRLASDLQDRLEDLDEKAAAQLITAWRGMACRNASLVEYCPVLSGCVGSNTAPLLLGAGDTAKGATMYTVKYHRELADARRHIQHYPSVAEDAGTAARCTRHFLQKVLNAGATELASTQAAAIVLGVSSSGHSHSFVNSYVWDAVRLHGVVQKGGALLSDAKAQCASGPPEADLAKDSVPDASAEADVGGSDDEVDAADDTGDGRTGTCSVYTTPDGASVPMSPAEHYAHRSPALDMMNFDEFVMSMHIAKKPA